MSQEANDTMVPSIVGISRPAASLPYPPIELNHSRSAKIPHRKMLISCAHENTSHLDYTMIGLLGCELQNGMLVLLSLLAPNAWKLCVLA
jgi:hypothetical protein